MASRVRGGLVVTGGSDAIRQSAEFATSIILARLLMPADFGVVAVVSSILQISYVVGNFGMGTAVIQANEVSDRDRHTAFALSSLTGLLLTACVMALAPWASTFFAMPALLTLIPIMSVQLLLSGISSIPNSLLRRDLEYSRVVAVEIGATIIYAIVGISMALSGYGVWSLVWAPNAAAVWTLIASFIAAGYRPGFALDMESARKFFGYGGGLTLKNVFVYLSRNVDNLIVAKMLGDQAAGLYTRAFNLTRLPQNRVVTVIYRVCFPAFCKLQNDRERLCRWYLNATAIVAVIATPVLLGIAAVSEDFTVALLGDKWAALAPAMRILSFAALLNCFHMLGGALIEAAGPIRYEVLTQSAYAAAVFIGCIAGAAWGILGVAYGVLAASVLFYVMKAWTVRAAVGIPISSFIWAAIPSSLAGLIMYVAVRAMLADGAIPFIPLEFTGHWQRLIAGTIVGFLIYIPILALIGRNHLKLLFGEFGAMTALLRRSPIESQPGTLRA